MNTPDPLQKISIGLEQLIYDSELKQQPLEFDVIIVGSGYGGAIAASELSQSGLSVAVLERGEEYLQGQFPANYAEISKHVRLNNSGSPNPVGSEEGLFDIKVGQHASVVLANGLGGGSLINAGVMEIPRHEVFDHRWPVGLQARVELDEFYKEVKCLLGAAKLSASNEIINNSILDNGPRQPQKYTFMKQQGGTDFRPAAITIALEEKETFSGIKLNPCTFCGDCATGCNFGAKESLDTNFLFDAWRNGVTLVTGVTCHSVQKNLRNDDVALGSNKKWRLVTHFTKKLLRHRHGEAISIYADKIILAAGSLGSTEILYRSQSDELQFSPQLGEKFSTNGDMVATLSVPGASMNSIAKQEVNPIRRNVGPTITAIIDTRNESSGQSFAIQELAIPNSLRVLFEEIQTTAELLANINQRDCSLHHHGPVHQDNITVNEKKLDETLTLTIFGDDNSRGTIQLNGDIGSFEQNGNVVIDWQDLPYHPIFVEQISCLKSLGKKSHGTIIANPLWQFLPDDMDYLAESKLRGPLTTVHPLGGCPMADNVHYGVVNEYGQVFDPLAKDGATAYYDGLVVLDGSIIPTALRTNPALTIAAITLRSVRHFKTRWQTQPKAAPVYIPHQRAVYRDIATQFNEQPTLSDPLRSSKTEFTLLERMGGEVTSNGKQYYLEVTLASDPFNLTSLSREPIKKVTLNANKLSANTDCVLRIYDYQEWLKIKRHFAVETSAYSPDEAPPQYTGVKTDADREEALNQAALFRAPLTGEIDVFNRSRSNPVQRAGKAFFAWLLNRGLRDGFQAIRNKESTNGLKGVYKRIIQAINLSTRAGEIRTIDYRLNIVEDNSNTPPDIPFIQAVLNNGITGIKQLTYNRRANPWRQLMELELVNLPNCDKVPILYLDMDYLAYRKVPLFSLHRQQDAPTALIHIFCFFGYLLRLFLSIHLWSFRLPEPSSTEPPKPLPSRVKGLPEPEIKEIVIEKVDGVTAKVRLTRYKNTNGNPLVAVHGYSASGTSFVHPSVNPNLASYLWHKGFDVWILDLRTSSGMASATYPWRFEDVAFQDIPAAFAYINRETGKPLNVVAHCMGAAMTSMAILAEPRNDQYNRFLAERTALPDMIDKIVLLQVGPRVQFTPDNVFRAYLMGYIRHFLPMKHYRFRIAGKATLFDHLLDRALSSLPYPEEEFDLINPPFRFWKKSPYVRTRQRMDALYGRDFSLKNVPSEVLDHIDDFFGPMSIETLSQTIHFSRWRTVTTKSGFNEFTCLEYFINRWPNATLQIHGDENGLSDIATVGLMKEAIELSGKYFRSFIAKGSGHQDCLIGKHAESVFANIDDFLNSSEHNTRKDSTIPNIELSATIPLLGPRIGALEHNHLRIGVGSSPGISAPKLVVLVPVKINPAGDHYAVVDNKMQLTTELNQSRLDFVSIVAHRSLWDGDSDGVMPFFIHYDGPLNVMQFTAMATNKENQHTASELHFLYDQHGRSLFYRVDHDWHQTSLEDKPLNLDLFDDQERANILHNITEVEPFISAITEAITRLLGKNKDRFEPLKIPQPNLNRKGNSDLKFILASCQYSEGLIDREPCYQSYKRLNHLIQSTSEAPAFIIQIGDQVYTDATAGLFDPANLDDRFRAPYLKLFQNHHVTSVQKHIAVYNMLDDHELSNDWEPQGDNNEQHEDHKIRGIEAYIKWQRDDLKQADQKTPLWFTIPAQLYPFFIMDTRTERQQRNAKNIATAQFISDAEHNPYNHHLSQQECLYQWLSASQRDLNNTPKFIACPAMPFPRKNHFTQDRHITAALHDDGWHGYPRTLNELVRFIVTNSIQNVVFLSGDSHLSMLNRIVVGLYDADQNKLGETHIVSIHSSGMYSPYPFANASKEDFILNDDFKYHFDDGSYINYQVTTEADHVVPGDGFAALELTKKTSAWRLTTEFSREGYSKVIECTLTDG